MSSLVAAAERIAVSPESLAQSAAVMPLPGQPNAPYFNGDPFILNLFFHTFESWATIAMLPQEEWRAYSIAFVAHSEQHLWTSLLAYDTTKGTWQEFKEAVQTLYAHGQDAPFTSPPSLQRLVTEFRHLHNPHIIDFDTFYRRFTAQSQAISGHNLPIQLAKTFLDSLPHHIFSLVHAYFSNRQVNIYVQPLAEITRVARWNFVNNFRHQAHGYLMETARVEALPTRPTVVKPQDNNSWTQRVTQVPVQPHVSFGRHWPWEDGTSSTEGVRATRSTGPALSQQDLCDDTEKPSECVFKDAFVLDVVSDPSLAGGTEVWSHPALPSLSDSSAFAPLPEPLVWTSEPLSMVSQGTSEHMHSATEHLWADFIAGSSQPSPAIVSERSPSLSTLELDIGLGAEPADLDCDSDTWHRCALSTASTPVHTAEELRPAVEALRALLFPAVVSIPQQDLGHDCGQVREVDTQAISVQTLSLPTGKPPLDNNLVGELIQGYGATQAVDMFDLQVPRLLQGGWSCTMFLSLSNSIRQIR